MHRWNYTKEQSDQRRRNNDSDQSNVDIRVATRLAYMSDDDMFNFLEQLNTERLMRFIYIASQRLAYIRSAPG